MMHLHTWFLTVIRNLDKVFTCRDFCQGLIRLSETRIWCLHAQLNHNPPKLKHNQDTFAHVNTLNVTPPFLLHPFDMSYFLYVASAATGPPTAAGVSSIWMSLSLVVIMHMTHVCANLQSLSQSRQPFFGPAVMGNEIKSLEFIRR